MRESVAKKYLTLTDQWNETSSEAIINNIAARFIAKDLRCETKSVMIERLSDITGVSTHTVYAWMNKGRSNVKVPLAKLCLIAERLKVDVREFLKPGE